MGAITQRSRRSATKENREKATHADVPPKKQRVAVVRTSDFTAGAELGRGGFCSVLEVQDCRIPLRRLSKRSPQKTTDDADPSTTSDKPKSKLSVLLRILGYENSATKKNRRSAPAEDDAKYKRNDNAYVVKLLRKDLTKRALSRGRLDLCIEAAHLLSIKNEHIIRVVAISRGIAKYLARDSRWKEESEFFIIMERLEFTLEDMIRQWAEEAKDAKQSQSQGGFGFMSGGGSSKKKKKEQKQRWLKKLEVARDVARAVRFLHENEVVYRDLKPSNIGFAFDGTTTIFDFGLAKTLSPKDELCNSLYRMTGHTGSLRYMAPEVAQDLPYNTSVDSYSFAMLLWQLCSYMPPYLGFTREKHNELVVCRGWRPPIGKKWPKGLVEIIKRCWSDNMTKRMDFEEIETTLDVEIDRIRSKSSSKW